MSEMEKENKASRAKAKTPIKAAHPAQDSQAKVKSTFCVCHQPDDGTPMVCCSVCDEWYHFRCVKLSEEKASELQTYVCPTCTESTGRRTVSECHRFFLFASVGSLHVHRSI